MKFEIYQKLVTSTEFKSWQKTHPQSYLSHFYCRLDRSFTPLPPWEIGFYSPKNDKITVFQITEKISLKPEEEVFKDCPTIEKLDRKLVKTGFPPVLEIFQKIKREHYPHEILFSGFLILQNFQHQTIWNISYITRSFQILNVKINAVNKKVLSHQLINFIEKKAG